MFAIVNIGVGGWYPQGQARLRAHCHGYHLEFADELPAGYPSHEHRPYMLKVLWLSRALQRHSKVLWLDCSVVPLRPIQDFVEYIQGHAFTKENGVYAYRSGMTVGQTCNDRALAISGLPKGAQSLPEFASTIVYIDKTKDRGRDVAYWWERLALLGAIKGSRLKEPSESRRKEFLFHRQDQSCLTLAMHKCGIDASGSDELKDVVRYSEDVRDQLPRAGNNAYALIAGGWENLKCYPCASVAAFATGS